MNRLFKAVAILTLPLLAVSCAPKETAQVVEKERVEVVKTTKLSMTEVARSIVLPSTLQGYTNVNISPSLSGNIEHIYVEIGDEVKKGQMLVRMDQNQYITTKMSLTNLATEYDRVKALYETGAVTEQVYDQTKLGYDQTKESLEFLEKNTFVKAPMKSVVAAKNYEDGELFAGTPILMLTEVQKLKAIINIPESYFPFVEEGMRLELTSDVYPDTVFPATIEVVYPTMDATAHTFSIKLKIENVSEMLRPGMYVSTELKLHNTEAIIVPYQSVLKLTGSNERYVFVNRGGKAKRISVKLGERFNEKIEIISNEIKVGDQLVTVGQAKLIDGVKLSVK